MILINGCSFTADYGKKDTWVGGFEDKGVVMDRILNSAAGGSSNKNIARRTFWHITNHKYDYAIIQWSTIDRWDYPVLVTEERAKNFPRVKNHPERIGKINYMCNGTDTLGYAKNFYENYYSIHGAVLETLESIYNTQLYLKEHNVPYKMITIGNLFNMDVSVEKLIELQTTKSLEGKGNYSKLAQNIFDKIEKVDSSWYEQDAINKLLTHIDFSKFIFTNEQTIQRFGGGMIDWFNDRNIPLTGGGFHPSKEEHFKFFNEFLWDNIQDDINKLPKNMFNNLEM
jgi:hypothetical protein